MASAAQILANQHNAQHSTGPRTLEGKDASSRNSTRHGLTGKQIVISGENHAEYDALLEGMRASFDPRTEAEHVLVEMIAASAWRFQRAQRLERAVLNKLTEGSSDPDAAMAIAFLEKPAEFTRLQRYIAQIERTWFRAAKELEILQIARMQQEQQAAMQKAYRDQVAQRAARSQAAPQHAPNGFVSSASLSAQPVAHEAHQKTGISSPHTR